VKPLSRDGARVAFKQLEAIAKVDHVEGRGWYGLRRIAADLAESATTDDRVKDRLGGWQDSETRKRIYQDRQTDELRAEAAKVRRALRLGGNPRANAAAPSVDLDALLAALTPEQQAMLARKSTPERVPRKNRQDPLGSRRVQRIGISRLRKSGRWDSNPRRPAWEGGRKTSAEWTTRQFSSEDAMLGATFARHFPPILASNGSRNGSRAATCQPATDSVFAITRGVHQRTHDQATPATMPPWSRVRDCRLGRSRGRRRHS
jgi:hypothetical protein